MLYNVYRIRCEQGGARNEFFVSAETAVLATENLARVKPELVDIIIREHHRCPWRTNQYGVIEHRIV